MPTMNLVLSEPLNEYVLQQAAEQGFDNANDYICDLLQEEKERMDLEEEILKGLESKATIPYTKNTLNEIYARAEKILQEQK